MPRLHLREAAPIRWPAGVVVLLVGVLLLAPAAAGQTQAPAGDGTPSAAGAAEAETDVEVAAAEDTDAKVAAAEETDVEVAQAEDRVPEPAPAEEIEVVGRRMQIVVPDPTVSSVGFDPAELKAEGISDIRDLSAFTPSLEIKSAFAASNPTIFIRGVGLDDYNANAASAVSIYQDGVYMQSPAGQLFQFFDTETVTVLRGPQPTLFRNAEAGAILVNSREPGDELDAYLTSSYGNYDLVEVEGALGGPIVPELLSGRVSATWGIRDGITKNRCSAPVDSAGMSANPSCALEQRAEDGTLRFQPGINPWTNDADAYAARGQLLFTPPLSESQMSWLVNVHGGKNRSHALQYQHRGVQFQTPGSEEPTHGRGDVRGYKDTDGDFFAGDYNLDGPEKIDLFGANLRGSWRFGDGYELRSLTAYEWHDRLTVENSDANPKYLLESEYQDDAWQLSQELDLGGSWGNPFGLESLDGQWRVGAYYLQDDLHVGNFFDTLAGVTSHLSQEYTQKTRNLAGYLRTEHRLRPGCELIPCDFTLIGGLRYNWEHKSFDTFVCETGATLCDRQALKGNDEDAWLAPGGEVSLSWDYAEDSSLYVKYSRGWKGGHFNGGATSVRDIITAVDPELVDAYEGGLRSFWFDRRLMLNATAFYYDYQDLQVFIIEQTDLGYPIPKLVNATDAVVYGIEVDVGAEPLPGLILTYNFAWVESEYLDFAVTFIEIFRPPRPCRTCPRPDPIEIPRNYVYTGNPLIASPRYSMTGSLAYTLPIPGQPFGWSLGSLTPRLSFSWKDEIFFDACSGRGARCNFQEGFFGEKPYWVFNGALTWRSENERFELMGWVHNFMDTHYKTQNFDLSKGLGVILDAYADPRTFGITATISF